MTVWTNGHSNHLKKMLRKNNSFFFSELRILAFPCNQFYDRMQEGDGDEVLCHMKIRGASLGGIMAKVRHFPNNSNINFELR